MPRGGLHPAAQVPAAFVEAWREAWRAAGYVGAWTYSVPQRSVDVLRELARLDDRIGGTELACRIGAAQSTLTTNTLPRLEQAGLVTSRPGEQSRPGAKVPMLWSLTTTGRRLMERDTS